MRKHIQKAVSFALALTLSASLMAGCKSEKETSAAKQDNVKLWYAYNTENLMKDLEYPELMAQRDQTLRMQC